MTNTEPPGRVRVTGPPRPLSRSADPTQNDPAPIDPLQKDAEDLFVRALIRDQLLLALRTCTILAVVLGSVPLIVWLWPDLLDRDLFGIGLVWWTLGVLPFPGLWLLGRSHLARAEHNERAYTDLTAIDP